MSSQNRQHVREEVLRYLEHRNTPVRLSSMAADLRQQSPEFKDLRDSDFRLIVQPMIATHRLRYADGLAITIGDQA